MEITTEGISRLLLGDLHESASNPRRHFDKTKLDELTVSVREKGVLVPLLVRPVNGGYELVAGARRFRAAKAAGLKEVPVIIKSLDDAEALELQLIENLQRDDVHPLDEGEGYRALLAQGKHDIKTLAARVGKSESYIYARLKLTDLVPAIKKAFLEDRITAGHAALLARLQPKDQERAFKDVFQHDYVEGGTRLASVRQLMAWIEREVHLDLSGAPWNKDDAKLLPGAGSCMACPKRTGTNPGLFPDIKKGDVCTDPTCFHLKLAAFIVKKQREVEDEGQTVVEVSHAWGRRGKDKPLPGGAYRPVKAGSCKHTIRGIFVDGAQAGQVIPICTEPKCRVHAEKHIFVDAPDTSERDQARRKAQERRTKAVAKARDEAVRQIAAAQNGRLSFKELRVVATSFWERLAFDAAKMACRILGVWPNDKQPVAGFDFRGRGRALVEKSKTEAELSRTLRVMALVPEYGQWGSYAYGGGDEIARLKQAARLAHVNLPKLERQFIADAKPKKKPTKKAKK